MALSSQVTGDLIALACFDLTDAETRVIMSRLPVEWRRALTRKGVIGLLPSQVTPLLFPRRRIPLELEEKAPASDPHLSLDDGMEEKEGSSLTPTSVSTAALDLLEHKYDDVSGRILSDLSLSLPPDAQHIASELKSEGGERVSVCSVESEDDEVANVSLSTLVDRQVSSSLSFSSAPGHDSHTPLCTTLYTTSSLLL